MSEKLFNSFDLDNNGYLSFEELKQALSLIYFGTFEETAETIFNFYDFNKDKLISPEDVKAVMVFLPLKCEKTQTSYKYQLESLEELDIILTNTFKGKPLLNLEGFLAAVQSQSDIYLQILCFLYQRCPFQERILKRVVKINKFSNSNTDIKNITLSLKDKDKALMKDKGTSVLLSTPSAKSRFSPVEEFLKSNLPQQIEKKSASFFGKSFNTDDQDQHLLFKNNNYNNTENEKMEERSENVGRVTSSTTTTRENTGSSKNQLEIVSTLRKYDSFTEETSVEMSGYKGMVRFKNEILNEKLIFAKEERENELKAELNDGNFNVVFTNRKISKKSSSFSQKAKQLSIDEVKFETFEDIKYFKQIKDVSLNSNSSSSCSNKSFKIESDIIDFPLTEKKRENEINNEEDKEENEYVKVIRKISDTIEFDEKLKQKSFEKNILFQGKVVRYLKEYDKVYSIWLVLLDQNIYYYSDEKKSEFTGFHHISGCFIKENGKTVMKNETYYSFSIIFSNKTRTYCTKDKNIAKEWTKHLRQSIGYQNFFDFYQIVDDLGKGSYGNVKLGVKNKTEEKVAIKILNKRKMKDNDLEQIRREVDIMKILNHDNIVTFIDHFENSEFIFIVMEYFKHGTLKDFMKSNKKLPEEECAKIIYQVGCGLKYLNGFGIIHRDIKPDNIMIDTKGEETIVKIADFGFSKVMSQSEKATESYGTIVYAAPEILFSLPYNSSVDIWSLGIMSFYLISRTYPFIDVTEKELAKKITNDKPRFEGRRWNAISKKAINFIESCLEKDMNERFNINQLLSHSWFKSFKGLKICNECTITTRNNSMSKGKIICKDIKLNFLESFKNCVRKERRSLSI